MWSAVRRMLREVGERMSFNVVARRPGFAFDLMPPPDGLNPYFQSMPHRNVRP